MSVDILEMPTRPRLARQVVQEPVEIIAFITGTNTGAYVERNPKTIAEYDGSRHTLLIQSERIKIAPGTRIAVGKTDQTGSACLTKANIEYFDSGPSLQGIVGGAFPAKGETDKRVVNGDLVSFCSVDLELSNGQIIPSDQVVRPPSRDGEGYSASYVSRGWAAPSPS